MRVFKPSDTLSIKKWRLFSRNFMLPFVIGFCTYHFLDFALNGDFDEQVEEIIAITGISILILSIALTYVLYLDWLWSIGSQLFVKNKSKPSYHKQVLLFCVYILCILVALGMLIVFSGINDDVNQVFDNRKYIRDYGLNYFGLIGILTLLAAICSTISTSSHKFFKQPPGALFIPIFLLILLFPLGYIILQPRLNQLNLQIDHDESPKIDDILDSPLT